MRRESCCGVVWCVQVGDGTTDFTPAPEESRALIRERYRVAPTLMMRFSDDSTDETPEMERILRAAMPAGAHAPSEPWRGSLYRVAV